MAAWGVVVSAQPVDVRPCDNGAPYTAVPVGYPRSWYVMDAARCTVGPGHASERVIRARCDEMNRAAALARVQGGAA